MLLGNATVIAGGLLIRCRWSHWHWSSYCRAELPEPVALAPLAPVAGARPLRWVGGRPDPVPELGSPFEPLAEAAVPLPVPGLARAVPLGFGLGSAFSLRSAEGPFFVSTARPAMGATGGPATRPFRNRTSCVKCECHWKQ